jgi:hypothetical protein
LFDDTHGLLLKKLSTAAKAAKNRLTARCVVFATTAGQFGLTRCFSPVRVLAALALGVNYRRPRAAAFSVTTIIFGLMARGQFPDTGHD